MVLLAEGRVRHPCAWGDLGFAIGVALVAVVAPVLVLAARIARQAPRINRATPW